MKILQIVQRPQRRGAEIFAHDLARRFEALGVEVRTVYLYRSEGPNGLPLHDTDICLDGIENHIFERFPGIHPALLRGVVRAIDGFRPVIVQVNGSRTVKYGAAAKRVSTSKAGWKLVYRNIGVPSDWHPSKWKLGMYRRGVMSQMDAAIGVSDFSFADARALYRLRAPWTVIPNGITPSRLRIALSPSEVRQRHGASSADMILIFVGRLEPAKRPDRFVRIVTRVAQKVPGVRGWVVGDGPMREEIEHLAREHGVGERIRFFGNVEDVASLMNAADVLVVTSDTEGIPATVLEAGFLGVPVVSTGVGGLPECVANGKTGILVEAGCDEALADAAVRLAEDSSLRKAMGQQARESVLERFLIDRVADRYLDFFSKLSGEPRYEGRVI